ncbi:MAG TPA: hypothetical protein ENJ19_01950, partial [Gammaproteobacteria bacterium]|nr:hypothetical protein [Gammaproteobacteria bacterium]
MLATTYLRDHRHDNLPVNRPARFALLVMLSLALSACPLGEANLLSDGSELIPPEPNPDAPQVITVGTGLTPTYTWSQNFGNVTRLIVVRTTDTTTVWGLESPNTESIPWTGVVHGDLSTASGAQEFDSGSVQGAFELQRELSPGVRYTITVQKLDGSSLTASFTTSNQASLSTAAALAEAGTAAVANPVTAVAAGEEHTLALDEAGLVWSWGDNSYGQLGDGTTAPRHSPMLVAGLGPAVAVAAGARHSLALTAEGRVWSWGSNEYGQLGDGSTTSRSTPQAIAGLSDVVEIGAGRYHSLARTRDGRLWTWGANFSGQLGDPAADIATR